MSNQGYSLTTISPDDVLGLGARLLFSDKLPCASKVKGVFARAFRSVPGTPIQLEIRALSSAGRRQCDIRSSSVVSRQLLLELTDATHANRPRSRTDTFVNETALCGVN